MHVVVVVVVVGNCIPLLWKCDGDTDCKDGSDEADCMKCNRSHFICNNGQCVPLSARCDSREDCADGEDERRCAPCPTVFGAYNFECTSTGECINTTLVCNGEVDCTHGEDEMNCDGESQMPPIPSSTTARSSAGFVAAVVIVSTLLLFVMMLCLAITCMRRCKRKSDPAVVSANRDQHLSMIQKAGRQRNLGGSSKRHRAEFSQIDDACRDGYVTVGGLCNGSGSALLPRTSGEDEEEEETVLDGRTFASIERPRLTGASSVASSSVRNYPEPLNPWPSEVSDDTSSEHPSYAMSVGASAVSTISSAAGINKRARNQQRLREANMWRSARKRKKREESFPHYPSECSNFESEAEEARRGLGDGGCRTTPICINTISTTSPARATLSQRRLQQQQMHQYYSQQQQQQQQQSDATFSSDDTFSDPEYHPTARPCSPVTEHSYFDNPPPSLVSHPIASNDDLSDVTDYVI